MTKNTKILLGVAAVAAVGYYLYNQNSKKSTAGFLRRGGMLSSSVGEPLETAKSQPCCGHKQTYTGAGGTVYECCDGSFSKRSKNKSCDECMKLMGGERSLSIGM